MKRRLFLILAATIALGCQVVSSVASSTAAPAPPPTADLPDVTIPTDTPAPPPTLAPTVGPSLTPTTVPLTIPTVGRLPQQWNGTYTYPTGQRQSITLLIEKVKESTFSGKMIWQSFGNSRGAILKMSGEYVTDFGNQLEQIKWKQLEDYSEVHREGVWLKWTETDIISGANYTTNGWYYAHIREDDTMVAIYFFSKDESTADSGRFWLQLVTR